MKQDLEAIYERLSFCSKLELQELHNALHFYEVAFQKRHFNLADQFLALCEPYLSQLPISGDFFYRNRAICAHYSMQDDKKNYYFKQASNLATHPLQYKFEELTCLPHIYKSVEHVQEIRQEFKNGLDELCEQINLQIKAQTLNFPLSMGNTFLLAYQGQNDKDIMQQIGQLWTSILGQQLIQVTRIPGQHRRLRIGFFSNYIYDHSIMICYGHLMAYFGQLKGFETSVFYIGTQWDQQTDFLKERVDHFFHLNVSNAFQTILQQELDILIYTDIGMDSHTYSFALHRLAPIQVVLPGHPVTTGLPHMDYYLANALAEPPDAQNHYSEALVLIPEGISFYQKLVVPSPLPRGELGWSEDAHIYFCPMTLYKIHPAFDELMEQILLKDSKAQIWLVKDKVESFAPALQKRLKQRLPHLYSRIQFLPWLTREKFFQSIQAADVCLDPIGFTGGSTARMILGLGQPMVTLPGEFMRGRLTLNCYRQMQLEELVATSEEDYVERAVKLATDKDYREKVQSKLQSRSHVLFEKSQNAEHIAQFLIKAVEAYPEKVVQ